MVKANLERCQPWRVKKARCRLCREACPVEGCVSFEENIISIDSAKCNGCGICAAACPAGALTVEGLDEAELVKRALSSAGKRILFACSMGPGEGRALAEDFEDCAGALRAGCLAVANESVLSALALSGAEVALDLTPCGGCDFKKGKEIIERSVRQAQGLLSAVGVQGRIKTLRSTAEKGKRPKKTFKELSPGPVYSRRELFSFLREKGEARINQAAGKSLKEDGKAPARRRVLLDVLEGALMSDGDKTMPDGHFPVRALSIGEGCTLCRRCEAFCPTAALKRVEEGGEARVEFEMSLCMGCHECAELCPAGALSYKGSIDLGDFKGGAAVLVRKGLAECPRCSMRYLPGSGACPSCAKKDRLEKRIRSMLFPEI